MYINTRSLAMCSGLALMAMVAGSTLADNKLSQDVGNARKEAQISTTYALSPYLRSSDISVSVKGNEARISGVVEEEVNKELAHEIAMGVPGIKSVDNQLTVEQDYKPGKKSKKSNMASERSYGEIVDDATITAAVKSKLVWSKDAEGLSTKVDTKSGHLTLQGKAASEKAKAHAENVAKNTRGVMSVDNQLVVDTERPSVADTAKRSANKTGSAISDGWITTKVKSTLMYSSNVSGSDISVNTTDGVVTLSGKVGSGAEQSLAIELAQNVRGVESVEAKGLVF